MSVAGRPDIVRPVGTTSSDCPFSHLGDSFRPPGQSCRQRFDRSVPPDTLPRPLDSWLLPSSQPYGRAGSTLRVRASIKHAPWAVSKVPRVTCHRHATLNLRGSPPVDKAISAARPRTVSRRARLILGQACGLPAASLVQCVSDKSKVLSSEPPDLVFREAQTSLVYGQL